MAERITIDQPAEKSATKSTNWIEVFNTNLKNLTAIITFAILIAGATWGALEKTRIESLKEQVAFWKEQIAERDKTVSELKSARDPDRKKIDELLATNQKIENDLGAAKDNLKQSRDNNAELQKRIKTYEANSNILSKIRELEKQKSPIDRNLYPFRTYINDENSLKGERISHEIQQRKSDELQARILSLQQQLQCESR